MTSTIMRNTNNSIRSLVPGRASARGAIKTTAGVMPVCSCGRPRFSGVRRRLLVIVLSIALWCADGFFPSVAPPSPTLRAASGDSFRVRGIHNLARIGAEPRRAAGRPGARRRLTSMAAVGRVSPGKGTQVVLLRHGMSTFNKLNIFTVSLGGMPCFCSCSL